MYLPDMLHRVFFAEHKSLFVFLQHYYYYKNVIYSSESNFVPLFVLVLL